MKRLHNHTKGQGVSLALFCFAAALLMDCTAGAGRGDGGEASRTDGDTIALRYAQNLTLVRHSDFVEAVLRNPWDTTQTLARYELRQPVRRAAVFTAVMCGLMEELGVSECIAGVADVAYVQNKYVRAGVRDGRIVDLGNGMEPNLERIMDLDADALLPSPFENSGGFGRMEQLGVPIIQCADYMEVSPLARAEWIRFYGILFGCEAKADSIFRAVEHDYLQLKAMVDTVSHRPTLMVDQPYKGVWYVPGARSTMGIMYHDAGAQLALANESAGGSLPIAMEAVLETGINADVWLMKLGSRHPITLQSLANDDATYRQFRAFQQGNVYICNTEAVPFYEETPFHPERLLANLISVLHPELEVKSNHTYYNKVQ